MTIPIIEANEIDFDAMDLAAFRTMEVAEDFRKEIMPQLNAFITKYNNGLYSVSIPYTVRLSLGKKQFR